MDLQQLKNLIGQEININNKFKLKLEGLQLHDEINNIFTLLFRQNDIQIKIPSQYIISFYKNVLYISIDPEIFIHSKTDLY